jgi:uncharacterized protein with ACT and thioredoxin-like domain
MKIFTLIFDTAGNGIYSQSFKTKNKALLYLKDWDDEEDMDHVISEIKKDGYYFHDDDKRSWGIILEEGELK